MQFLLLYFKKPILLLTQLAINLKHLGEKGEKWKKNPQGASVWGTDNISDGGDFQDVTHEL